MGSGQISPNNVLLSNSFRNSFRLWPAFIASGSAVPHLSDPSTLVDHQLQDTQTSTTSFQEIGLVLVVLRLAVTCVKVIGVV
jgi:hypothetical protein